MESTESISLTDRIRRCKPDLLIERAGRLGAPGNEDSCESVLLDTLLGYDTGGFDVKEFNRVHRALKAYLKAEDARLRAKALAFREKSRQRRHIKD